MLRRLGLTLVLDVGRGFVGINLFGSHPTEVLAAAARTEEKEVKTRMTYPRIGGFGRTVRTDRRVFFIECHVKAQADEQKSIHPTCADGGCLRWRAGPVGGGTALSLWCCASFRRRQEREVRREPRSSCRRRVLWKGEAKN